MFVYEGITAGQSVTQVADLLADQITALTGSIDFTRDDDPGLTIQLKGTPALSANWALTLDDGTATELHPRHRQRRHAGRCRQRAWPR